MSYNSENRPSDSPAQRQQDPYAPKDASADRYVRNGHPGSGSVRRPQSAQSQPGTRSASRNNDGSLPFVLSPRGVSRRDASAKERNPLAVVAVVSSALALVLAIILIIVLSSRKDEAAGSAAPAPTQAYASFPAQTAMPYPTSSHAGFPVITPSPAPSQTQTPIQVQTPIQIQTPTPNQVITPAPGSTYTAAGVLAAAKSAAENNSRYSTVSDKDVELEIPADSAFLRTPFLKRVNAGESGRAIYIMPKPIPGNGVLGTLYHGTQVTVLAETEYYYFFVTQDGRAGWNGKSYFMDP